MINHHTGGKQVEVLATRIESLAQDIGEMKTGIALLAAAVSKLAVVESNQAHMVNAQERAFKALERMEMRQSDHEASCRQQEKDLLTVISRTTEKLAERIEHLEKSEPLQLQTSQWVFGAVWASLGVLALFVAQRGLTLIFP